MASARLWGRSLVASALLQSEIAAARALVAGGGAHQAHCDGTWIIPPLQCSWALVKKRHGSAIASVSASVPQASSSEPEAPGPAAAVKEAMELCLRSGRHREVIKRLRSAEASLQGDLSGRTDPAHLAPLYDLALLACAALGDGEGALRLVGRMWRFGIPVGFVAQGSTLKALCAAGRRADALRHLRRVPRRRLSAAMFNAVMAACNRAGDVEVGLAAWAMMQRRDVAPDVTTWRQVLRLHGRAGDAAAMHSEWDKARDELPKAQQFAVDAAAAVALSGLGDLSGAVDACDAALEGATHVLPLPIETPFPEPAPVATDAADVLILRGACNAVLHAAVRADDDSSARKLTSVMVLHGLPPDVSTYNALLELEARHGAGPAALHEGVREMGAVGVVPDAKTLQLLLRGHAVDGDAEGALRTLAQHPDIELDERHHALVLQAFGAAGDLVGMEEHLKAMVSSRDGGSGTSMAEAFCSAFRAVHKWELRSSESNFWGVFLKPL
jgi:pentatricopeptide repeat protein